MLIFSLPLDALQWESQSVEASEKMRGLGYSTANISQTSRFELFSLSHGLWTDLNYVI